MVERPDAWFDSFEFGPERQLEPFPGQRPDPDVLLGYYELERSERHLTNYTFVRHRRQIERWYRLLTSYYRALDIAHVKSENLAWFTVWKILRLGISAAKGALDATLAGYYVGAFGDIRQMTEYWFGIEYLGMNPESVNGFYRAKEGEDQVQLPRMGKRIKWVLEAFAQGGSHEDPTNDGLARMVHESYKRMSNGHHLGGLAMVQTGGLDDPGYFLGASYNPQLIREAFYHGRLLTGTLGMVAATHMSGLLPNWHELQLQISAQVLEVIEELPLKDGHGASTS